jgi:hypothetical protein
MSIWGQRNSEPSAEEAQESRPPAQADQPPAPGEPELQAEPEQQAEAEQAGEPAPAFWRAQGEDPASFGRAPDGTPAAEATAPAYGQMPGEAPAHNGQQAPAEAPAPPAIEYPADTGAPGPMRDEDVVVLDAETVVKDPALAQTAGAPVAPQAAATAEPAAAEPATAAPGGISAQRWSEIMATFVDDPRGSVTMAAAEVDPAIDELVNSLRARQRALASRWQSTETGTEQLRTALRDYRKFWLQVQQLDPAGKTGS